MSEEKDIHDLTNPTDIARERLAIEVKKLVEQNESVDNKNDQPVTQQVENHTELSAYDKYVNKYGKDIVDQAMTLRWDPNHVGKTFVEPDEYIRRQPLFEKIDRQSKELRELKELQKQTSEHLTLIRKEAYEKAIKELESQRLVKVSEGDTMGFQQLEAQANALKQKMETDPLIKPQHVVEQPAQSTQPTLDPAVESWGQRNSEWYNSNTVENKKMKAAAEAVDHYLVNAANIEGRQINVIEHLNAIEEEVKRLFPHRFNNVNKELPIAVGKSTVVSNKDTKSSSNLVSLLSTRQKELGLQFQKWNPEYTLEKYAKDLYDSGVLNK